MKKWIEKLQNKWNVSLWGFIAIMTAFSLAGMTVVRIRQPLLSLILPDQAPGWVWWVTYIILIVPMYQICLVFYGAILGQFRFFWEKEKKIILWLAGRFSIIDKGYDRN